MNAKLQARLHDAAYLLALRALYAQREQEAAVGGQDDG